MATRPADTMQNTCISYAERMQNICGTYAEHMQNSCGAASMAGGQALPSTSACAVPEYAEITHTGTTWASPWAGPWPHGLRIPCGTYAEHMRNICGTYAEHMRNSCGAASMAGGQALPSTSACAVPEYAEITHTGTTWASPWAGPWPHGLRIPCGTYAEHMRNICGTYAEHMRDSCGAASMAGGQALPSTSACAVPEYAEITHTGTTWASPWAGPWPHGLRIPFGTYAEHTRNIRGTYVKHMRNSCGAAS